MHVDRARHADRPQKQRDEANETQEGVHVVQRAPQVALAVLDGVKAQPLLPEPLAQIAHQRLGVDPGGEFVPGPVAHQAARLDEVRPVQGAQRNVDPRGQHRHRRRFAGHFFQRAGDRERGFADPHRVAHLQAKLRQQGVLQHGAVAP